MACRRLIHNSKTVKTVFGASMAETFFNVILGPKVKKLSYTQAPIPATAHDFLRDFRIGWGFLLFFSTKPNS